MEVAIVRHMDVGSPGGTSCALGVLIVAEVGQERLDGGCGEAGGGLLMNQQELRGSELGASPLQKRGGGMVDGVERRQGGGG
mmetsp:Transcript_32335/g.96944  ORF Transcript_32335/g.96944 Transcript_32335/m.96944 type:complete len:82 (-) Transcript_32335:248-493(-)